jgi:hypothetical protein
MSFGFIFCTLLDLIIIYIKIFCPEFLKLKCVIFNFFKKIGYMELELHLKFSIFSLLSYR